MAQQPAHETPTTTPPEAAPEHPEHAVDAHASVGPGALAAGPHAGGPSAGEHAYGDPMMSWAATVTGKHPTPHGAHTAEELKARMKAKYGVHPHSYSGVVGGDNTFEQQLRAALPGVVAHLNAVAAKRHLSFRFTEAELATNFITEGGFLLLENPMYQPQAGQPISGFGFLGIDTFMQRKGELTPWMSDDLKTWSNDPAHAEGATNERGQAVKSMQVRDVAQGVEANGVMFADARQHFATDCAARGIDTRTLPPEAWFFWTTVYYNSGEGTGKKLLAQHGIDFWKQPWHKADDANQFGTNVKFNASWRTASWDYMRQTSGDHLEHAGEKPATKPEGPATQ